MSNTKNNISSFRFLTRPLKLAVLLGVMILVMPMVGWGATVTYHIINLGRLDDSGQLTTSTRTEALQFTSTTLTVGLPNQYKSPLAKNWQYYSSSDVTYNPSTKVCVFNSGPSLSVGDVLSDGDHDVYVTYEFDEEALSTVGLFDGGICKIKFSLTNQYLQQTVYNGDPNTGSYPLQENSTFYWKVNIKDPYQITIQSQSTTYIDYYLSADAGKYGDIRLKSPLSTAKTNKVWAFGLLPDVPTNTYRLIVTDGYTYHASQDGIDQFGHGYLNNNDIKSGVRKTRYQKYDAPNYSNCALTFVPLTKTYNIINSLGETLVQATTTDYPLDVPDVIKSPFASYTYYSTQADAIAGTNPINSVTSTTIYVRYTTQSGDLNLNGGTNYIIRTNDNYLYAASSTTLGIESSLSDPPANTRKWKITGNDAYQLTIQNVDNSQYVTYDVSSGEAVPTLSGTGSKFFLHQSTTGQYEVVAITSGYYSTNYYTMGVANSTLKLYSSSNYPMGQDEVQSVIYSQPTCATPVISFDNTTSQVTITCATEGATIHYTTNEDEPTESSPSTPNPFPIDAPTTVKAIATLAGYLDSEREEKTIEQVAQPIIQNNGSNAISITTTTPGAAIYYTTNGDTPTTSSTEYMGPLTEGASGVLIKAIAVKEDMINSPVGSGTETLQCAMPVITRDGMTFSISCSMPTDATLYYSLDGTTPSIQYSTPVSFTADQLPMTVTAVAKHANYTDSEYETFDLINGTGTPEDPYLIYSVTDYNNFVTNVNNGTTASASYRLMADLSVSGTNAITRTFAGTFDGNFHTLTNLGHPLFSTVDGGVVKNVMLKNIIVSGSGNTGAICNEAIGASRIYNCGILPSDPSFTNASSVKSTSGYCGGLVGLLDGTSRVINCFSYATITGGTTVAGIVGYNNTSGATQDNYANKTIVMNCMFYGEITGGSNKYPVYGGNIIDNSGSKGINNYNYYREEATFDDGDGALAEYNRSWPAKEKNLRRFEYYRSILNSNRRLCAFWITDHAVSAQTSTDTDQVAKWVVDPSIAPFPILKKWGKYPSIINIDPAKVWDKTNNRWVERTASTTYHGKKLGELTVTIKTGAHPGTVGLSVIDNESRTLVVTDMDTTCYDYCYGKVQLPYYNEIFGNPSVTLDPDHPENYTSRYYGNYTNKVVTGWKITYIDTDETITDYHEFSSDWETGCNFADRHCIDKDLYSTDNRVFAQGGYYYVPEGVTGITIEAYWGVAFYLQAKDNALDRVDVAGTKNYGSPFTPAGTLPTSFTYNNGSTNQPVSIYNDFATIMTEVKANTSCNVYDQAIVLLSNFPLHAEDDFKNSVKNSGHGGITMMSADFDMDNEPDCCFPFQWRAATTYTRFPIMPFRFDFLPIPELGMAMRHNTFAYSIGIFVPEGHFEITETSFIYTTQFEYMSNYDSQNHQKPLILNGGQYEQIVCHADSQNGVELDHTRNIILGGHVWMKRFTPGSHTERHCFVRHCAVSVMGGEYPEFYLTGHYWAGADATHAYDDSPHCYTLGGKFGIMAGASTEAVRKDVVFEIDHSIIREFYGGGCNSANPVCGDIKVTIDHSLVLDKYCGGPKVGEMTNGKTVVTNATGTHFCGHFYGGGNGGTNLYRQQIKDATPNDVPSVSDWNGTYGFTKFNPLNRYTEGSTRPAAYDATKGYHAQFEFEVFNQSNGLGTQAVARTYYLWAQFGKTRTGAITNTLNGCVIDGNFYGGGNLGNVGGEGLGDCDIITNLTNDTILGNVFGAGFSADIPSFMINNREVHYPYRDDAGVMHNGTVDTLVDGSNRPILFEWTNDNNGGNASTDSPTYSDGTKSYCYTPVSLLNLGTASGNATLTLKGNTIVGHYHEGNLIGGNVYGGGDASAVTGNTTVTLQGSAHVLGNVYGGGNRGPVGGDSKVEIQDP